MDAVRAGRHPMASCRRRHSQQTPLGSINAVHPVSPSPISYPCSGARRAICCARRTTPRTSASTLGQALGPSAHPTRGVKTLAGVGLHSVSVVKSLIPRFRHGHDQHPPINPARFTRPGGELVTSRAGGRAVHDYPNSSSIFEGCAGRAESTSAAQTLRRAPVATGCPWRGQDVDEA